MKVEKEIELALKNWTHTKTGPKFSVLLVLVFSTPVFLIALWYFRGNPVLQFQTLTVATLLYVILALLHHLKSKYLTLEILIEYILIATLALIILQSIIYS
ncbi:hypothetical protein A3C32_02325 [Candidatus Daviesbacteria bacterium RIFCSPHIGHO2_02_FULL_41_14]|uniref:Uncharacterized protein n=1 Tax=Candidatus Daviesbacteria bacterium RIFCSPLOWO2_01_FULL_40_24 TaxID=1797787 RepID=A0A1F5MKB6_9BACT|nr:MAG: hypothetical protein A2780_01390 [Candidatus Daviesbacteria bacterium RIFCSPHIGHO2_01_FULL_41_45]OGE35136.1 MAG: hypothetical protein A3C32_02325 [Candidatus Daviesbacteria bacterium RIFCSPHIGHO2_02_FULL_41_14]OGE65788.1 MAG: hypothetical protein A3B49_01580 [Candidatus Daviesbacteria bacterium RIFCSPLOWO2_01_FULL_40_24]